MNKKLLLIAAIVFASTGMTSAAQQDKKNGGKLAPAPDRRNDSMSMTRGLARCVARGRQLNRRRGVAFMLAVEKETSAGVSDDKLRDS
jgi:hypothetical protein